LDFNLLMCDYVLFNLDYEAHYEARKITTGFSGFGPKKPDPNRTGTGRSGLVPVRFGSLFFFFLPSGLVGF